MKIVISNEAIRWFQEEMDVESGDSIQFFARYGGCSPLHEGFSIGLRKAEPDDIAVEMEQAGVRFYIEERDKWFFAEHDLHVNVDQDVNELVYTYEKA